MAEKLNNHLQPKEIDKSGDDGDEGEVQFVNNLVTGQSNQQQQQHQEEIYSNQRTTNGFSDDW